MMRTESIPILLVAGFLGSGKTSLLNNILQNNQGLKIGVLINDFGQINVDAMLVSAQTENTLELSNGCICCSVEDEGLDNALGQLAHKGSRLDYIIIEASGLAETRELVTMLRLIKNNYTHFDSLVTIVDGKNFAKNNKAHDKALADLEIADLIIINKVDLISKQELADIRQAIKLVAPETRTIPSVNGQVDFRILLDLDTDSKKANQLKIGHQHPDDHDRQHDHDHLHDKFQSVSFQTDKPFDPAAFEKWAGDLDQSIYRAKGIIYFGTKGLDQKFIFQAVGSRFKLKLDEWQLDEKQQTSLVVIGLGLDETKLKDDCQQLIDRDPDNVTAETLMDILQYKK